MKRPGDSDDDFERMLEAALDPGEICLSPDEKAEILATTEFMALLSNELDPGEIEFEPAQRQDLVVRLSAATKAEDLTAWALGELPVERSLPLEARMQEDEDLRTEGLAIRNFCRRAELLLRDRRLVVTWRDSPRRRRWSRCPWFFSRDKRRAGFRRPPGPSHRREWRKTCDPWIRKFWRSRQLLARWWRFPGGEESCPSRFPGRPAERR